MVSSRVGGAADSVEHAAIQVVVQYCRYPGDEQRGFYNQGCKREPRAADRSCVPRAAINDNGARIAAQSGVIGDIEPGVTVSGYPARSHREVLRQVAALRRLAPLVDRLERLVNPDASGR